MLTVLDRPVHVPTLTLAPSVAGRVKETLTGAEFEPVAVKVPPDAGATTFVCVGATLPKARSVPETLRAESTVAVALIEPEV